MKTTILIITALHTEALSDKSCLSTLKGKGKTTLRAVQIITVLRIERIVVCEQLSQHGNVPTYGLFSLNLR